jgi:hypothetical protein
LNPGKIRAGQEGVQVTGARSLGGEQFAEPLQHAFLRVAVQFSELSDQTRFIHCPDLIQDDLP